MELKFVVGMLIVVIGFRIDVAIGRAERRR
jgi:hypothetical protein